MSAVAHQHDRAAPGAVDSLDAAVAEPLGRIVVGPPPPEVLGPSQEPITAGVPFRRGACLDEASLCLTDEGGRELPLQARVLERWPDGSIRWLLADFQHATSLGAREYALARAATASRRASTVVRVELAGNGADVDTGAARFRLRPEAFPFDEVLVGGRSLLGADRARLVVEDGDGTAGAPVISRIVVEEAGPLRAVVRMDGAIGLGRRRLLEVVARLHFFAGAAAVRVAITLRNPERAAHRGGFWELGDAGAIFLRDASIVVNLTGRGPAVFACSADPGRPLEACVGRVELYQDSSGGEHWDSRNHANREGRVANRFRGYRLSDRRSTTDGFRATPLVLWQRADLWAALTMHDFWQNFPKAVEADDEAITLRLWPRQYDDVHELQGGEQKTHVFTIAFGEGAPDPGALAWARSPSPIGADPATCCASEAVPWLSPAAREMDADYLRIVNAAIEGPHAFEARREPVDEYGWRHFGDLYADHEATRAAGAQPILSHYNNQYDAIAGFAHQFLRSGDTRWRRAMDELAAHVADIDIYHTDRDKSAYSGGLFWHTCHYADAGLATHRAYPRNVSNGGGPGNEHDYSTGLMLHYFLTGNALSRESAVGLADWVVNMDDGARTIFRWIDRGPTGLASSTYSPGYHGPGRGAAYSIQTLLNGYRLTGAWRFIEKAESLVRRCIHPDDDITARDLLDRERRWSYTVFLQALGRYLLVKEELGSIDATYRYARASLLHYARWMAVHEYPYLDRPEELEYPTETWAAQEARKSEVFDLAAQHVSGAERQRFLDKAAFFWRCATASLLDLPGHTLTRPIVLMLGHGFLRARMRHDPGPPAPADAGSSASGAPEVFVPQKARVKARLLRLAVAGAAAAIAVVIWWIA